MTKSEKKDVHDYWNEESCGTGLTDKKKYSKDYFDEIEVTRYKLEPFIHSFAEFEKYNNKSVLEVGVGAGTDFINWVRNGAISCGIDLTNEAIENVKHRLSLENLKATNLKVADAEKLPIDDNKFDLVYSWGVLHHSPFTENIIIEEIWRVLKPGGKFVVLLYHTKNGAKRMISFVKSSYLKISFSRIGVL